MESGGATPFPNADRAVVSEDKARNYLLNLSHPVGGPKAIWFLTIGYSQDDWQLLAADLLRVALTCEDFIAKPSSYGVKYETMGEICVPPHQPGRVTAVWIVEEGNPPRLVTAYPE